MIVRIVQILIVVCAITAVDGGRGVLAQQPSITVTWRHSERFTDIRPVRDTRERFESRLFTELEQFIRKQATPYIRKGQSLGIEIRDIDLAGEIKSGYLGPPGHMVRVLDKPFFARIDLAYTLADAAGKIITKGQKTLRQHRFHRLGKPPKHMRHFYYEKALIEDWLRSTFSSGLGH
ncbi:MAG: DUF3016 domain-containing protein [Myxococcota bacterium]|nr:DUF3016 domain-containing protein [Myxococcota bacterium]